MSSKSDGNHYDTNQMSISNVKPDSSIGLKDLSCASNIEDIDRNRFNTNGSVENNTTHLATFSQPQTSRSCQIEPNKNIALKTLSFTNTPIRQYSNTATNKMQQPPPHQLLQQQYPSSQPLPMSSKPSNMVGK